MPDRFLKLAVLLFGLAACSPVYEPAFRLEAPEPLDAQARQCIADCNAGREACFSPARDEVAACTSRALLQQDQCRSNAQIDYQICQSAYAPEGQNCFLRLCERPACEPVAIRACEADYRRCFAACGGRVVEERRCVANCPS